MIEQATQLKRCASCERWDGPRTPAAGGEAVLLDSPASAGLCRGGPWDGQPRKAHSACGRWLRWQKLGHSDQRS